MRDRGKGEVRGWRHKKGTSSIIKRDGTASNNCNKDI